ncbi:retrotransposon protein, putative, ty1-copia subclass [Tanacetum coccineum]
MHKVQADRNSLTSIPHRMSEGKNPSQLLAVGVLHVSSWRCITALAWRTPPICSTITHIDVWSTGAALAVREVAVEFLDGIKIYRDRSRRLIGLCQSAYIEKILKRFFMENSKRGSIPMQVKLRLSKSQGASTPAELKRMQNVPYASAVGSIMYAMRCTRPDVAFAQNITSRFQQNLGDLHWTTVKNILKYLMNTKDMFFVYGGDLKRELRVSCYTDAGYLTDADDLKSQTGYVFVLNRGAVDWKSAKQSIFATSSVEAEYIAAFDSSKEAVWVRKFISGLGVVPTIKKPINMYCDNTRAITIANESGITKGARHFRAKVHYLREVIEFGGIKLEKVYTYDNLADPFTKALAFPKHSELTRNIGMLPASSLMSVARLGMNNNVPALEDAIKATTLAPNYPQAYVCKADALMAMEQYDAAGDSYSMALHLDPSIRRSKSFKVPTPSLHCFLVTTAKLSGWVDVKHVFCSLDGGPDKAKIAMLQEKLATTNC